MPKQTSPLPDNLPPRGLRREAAAAYLAMSVSKFNQLVAEGRAPAPIRIDRCVVWDRKSLDRFFDSMSGFAAADEDQDGSNPFDNDPG